MSRIQVCRFIHRLENLNLDDLDHLFIRAHIELFHLVSGKTAAYHMQLFAFFITMCVRFIYIYDYSAWKDGQIYQGQVKFLACNVPIISYYETGKPLN